MSKTYFIETYGCQMNVADSELVKGLMQEDGLRYTDNMQDADILFINTCAVREHAEEKVHSQLGRYNQIKKKKPDTIIGVLGCMAQHLKNDILENKPYVDMVLGPDSYRKLPDIIRNRTVKTDNIVDTTLSKFEVYDDLFPSRNEGINAWVSIMRGCDKFCTFCIVPFTRGRERSRNVGSIISEVTQAVAEGFVEITLLGQNVNSYTHGNDGFPALLDTIATIDGVKRIRYTSPHPQDINEELLEVMAAHDTICNYVHLPLQAGNNRILKRMNRTYSREYFADLVNLIRNKLPDVGISTDIIVGFPGETESEFEETLGVMEKVKFDSAFTFKYSPRPGTKAAEFTDHLPEKIKQSRLESVIKLQKRHTLERNLDLVKNVEMVLVEKESKRSSSHWAGRTDSNKWVIFEKGTAKVKDFVPVLITAAKGISLHGELAQKEEAIIK